jgi:hypothetical protein
MIQNLSHDFSGARITELRMTAATTRRASYRAGAAAGRRRRGRELARRTMRLSPAQR